MKITSFSLATLAAFNTVAGHSVFTTLFVNDVDQGDGTCVRMSMTPSNATFPINDLAGNEMACGYGGTMGVARVCPVSQSAKLSFLYREYADASQPGSMDSSHKGPCAVYMKVVSSAVNDTAVGNGWFKILEDGYDATKGQWCTEKLEQNGGFLSANIPSDLASGYYLVRPELLSLHESDKIPPNPQFYAGCAQIFLSSTGAAVPKDTVSIPGHVKISDPSVLFNIYEPKWPYPMPGPTPYVGGSSPNTKVAAAKLTITQDEGMLPDNVVLTNANWWGIELDPYFTEAGCRNASKSCWAQTTTCYNSAPPTGSKNCKIWEDKCQAVNDACDAGNFNGPPEMGKNLEPSSKMSYTSIPAPYYGAAMSDSMVASMTLSMSMMKTMSSIASGMLTSFTGSSIMTTTNTLPLIVVLPTTSVFMGTSSVLTLPTATLMVSVDAKCGPGTGKTCMGSKFGPCCSSKGWCGNTTDYCAVTKCQAGFGTCWTTGPGAAGMGVVEGDVY